MRVRTERPRNQGLTLVETMVALLVIAIGMLGLAALHNQALSASSVANHRSLAVSLAGSMADRIRANRLAVGAYAGQAGDNNCDASMATGVIDCSPAELAASDLLVWQTELAQMLPGGVGTVAVNTASHPAIYTVTVAWNEPAAAEPVRFSFEFRQQPF